MQIVIDIDEESYEMCKLCAYLGDESNIERVIATSTPLPKGHGRLIDAAAFQKYCFDKNFDKRLSDGGLATINMFLEFQPTIIEADKGDSE